MILLLLVGVWLIGECAFSGGPITNLVLKRLEGEPHGHREAPQDHRVPIADDGPSDPVPTRRAAGLGPDRAVYASTGRTVAGLPVVEDDVVLAHRSARLFWNDGDVRFGAIMHDVTFGVDTTATCQRAVRCTEVPNPRHKCCGFYAVPLDVPYEYRDHCELIVELYGRIVEHDRGYRAAFQRVIECRLLHCSYPGCDAPTEFMSFEHTGWCVDWLCLAHKADAVPGKIRTRAEFVAACPVTVVDL